MIARTWRGHTRIEDGDAYTKLLERTGVKDCRSTEGNRGVVVLRRRQGETAEFLFISFWEDFEAIQRFAGPDVEKAFYYPEDDAYLLGKEPRVTHYEVASNSFVSEESLAAPRFAGHRVE